MYCVRCGREMREGDDFCPACGKPSRSAPPLMPQTSRIAGHIRLLGILWIAISVFRLLPGVAVFIVIPFIQDMVPGFVVPLMQAAGVLILAAGGVGIAAGWGLLERHPWARTLTIVLAAIGLLDMPIGTALGIYTFWVLLPAQSSEEYSRAQQA